MQDPVAADMTVLILCTGNSCRSQMAEGILRRLAAGRARILSAGIEAHGLNPWAVRTMAAAGMDISGHSSKTIDQVANEGITHVITVCDHAAEVCPVLPGIQKTTHHSFPDPAKFQGSEEEKMIEFERVRKLIEAFLVNWWARNEPNGDLGK